MQFFGTSITPAVGNALLSGGTALSARRGPSSAPCPRPCSTSRPGVVPLGRLDFPPPSRAQILARLKAVSFRRWWPKGLCTLLRVTAGPYASRCSELTMGSVA